MPTPNIATLQAAAAEAAKLPAKSIEEELETLDERRRPQAAMIAKSALKRYVPLYFRALRRELSPRAAIRMHCYHCCGWERREAAECTSTGCPLWMYRPKAKA
jgi:hypothetical protein